MELIDRGKPNQGEERPYDELNSFSGNPNREHYCMLLVWYPCSFSVHIF